MGRLARRSGLFSPPRSGGRQGWERWDGGGGIGVAPAPAASERKIWNFCHRAAEPLASIGELPPPSVFMMGGAQIGNGPGLSPAEGAGHGAACSHSRGGITHAEAPA